MPPKHKPGPLRTHSRTSSSTKLNASNLQFTAQKKAPPRQKPHQPQPRAGFHIAALPDEEEDEDEEWVSSTSGAMTPNNEPETDDDSDAVAYAADGAQLHRIPTARATVKNGELHRVFTADLEDTTRKRRPMSTELRPHPLIRGQSYGQPAFPLAVTDDAEVTGQLSTSPSPTLHRRPSVSSAHSVATLPSPYLQRAPRNRTFSTLSAASSSLSHFPARTPAQQQSHLLAFFPSPHAQPVEAIHPLLPPPYVQNHLTVVASRTPIVDAFDRVVRARQSIGAS